MPIHALAARVLACPRSRGLILCTRDGRPLEDDLDPVQDGLQRRRARTVPAEARRTGSFACSTRDRGPAEFPRVWRAAELAGMRAAWRWWLPLGSHPKGICVCRVPGRSMGGPPARWIGRRRRIAKGRKSVTFLEEVLGAIDLAYRDHGRLIYEMCPPWTVHVFRPHILRGLPDASTIEWLSYIGDRRDAIPYAGRLLHCESPAASESRTSRLSTTPAAIALPSLHRE